MSPISQERFDFLIERNKMLDLMRQEFALNSRQYASVNESIHVQQQVRLNIETELLQNIVELGAYKRNFSATS